MSKTMLGVRVNMKNSQYIRSVSDTRQVVESEHYSNPQFLINKDNILDWEFKLNVSLPNLETYKKILNDTRVLLFVAAIPSYYMSFAEICKEVEIEYPNTELDWMFIIPFLIGEGIWCVRYAE